MSDRARTSRVEALTSFRKGAPVDTTASSLDTPDGLNAPGMAGSRADGPLVEPRRVHRPGRSGARIVAPAGPASAVAPLRQSWWFLGTVLEEYVTANGCPVVGTLSLPEGASPPLHVHIDLDDSFYVIEGKMVVRCGDEVALAREGSWVPFPAGVPHTFRVLDGPARLLLVHADDSFLEFVRAAGRPATAQDVPDAGDGPNADELARLSAAHGITNVGPPMTEEEARSWLVQLA